MDNYPPERIAPKIADSDTVPPASKEQAHDALKAASANLPRYLFRAWSEQSGGSKGLNTPERMVPLAFSSEGRRPHTSIFDIDHQLVVQTIHNHLRDKVDFTTFFSSWSNSLAHAVSLALDFQSQDPTTTRWHISVLDTKELSREVNWIFWCGARQLYDLGVDTFPEEYHVFGGVSGAYHSAVPLERLLSAFRSLPHSANSKGCGGGDFETAISPADWVSATERYRLDRRADAVRIGRLFGERFQLIVAVFYLCCATQVSKDDEILRELFETFGVDADHWSADESIMQLRFDSEGKSEAEDAMRTLRRLVETKLATDL